MTEYQQAPSPLPADWPLDWGRLLRTARQVAGLSLSDLSRETGLSKGHLSKLESGHPTAANPSRATLAALARALPSFRALANTLEPSEAVASLVFGDEAASMRSFPDDDDDSLHRPVRLGWRELELVMAMLALDGSASPIAVTALLLARSVGRRRAEVQPILDDLVAMGVLTAHMPRYQGAQLTYEKATTFAERTGIVRIGDALVLAAGLLAQAPIERRTVRDGSVDAIREA